MTVTSTVQRGKAAPFKVVPADAPLVLLVEQDADARRAADLLARAGLGDVAGYVVGAAAVRGSGLPVGTLPNVSVQELAHRIQHEPDLVVVDVRDPRESELPPVGLLTLVDPETGRLVEVQTSNPKVRARFAEAAAAQHEARVRAARAASAAHLVLSTDRDWLRDIVSFVVARRRRR